MRLSPLDTEMFPMQSGIAMAHLMERRFDEACAWAEKAFRDTRFVLSAPLSPQDVLLQGARTRRDAPLMKFASSTLRYDAPPSMGGSHFIVLRTSPSSRTECGWRGYRSSAAPRLRRRPTMTSKHELEAEAAFPMRGVV